MLIPSGRNPKATTEILPKIKFLMGNRVSEFFISLIPCHREYMKKNLFMITFEFRIVLYLQLQTILSLISKVGEDLVPLVLSGLTVLSIHL